eukprot:7744690-Ditylum_brightwellii.AAC.1
MNCLLSSTQSVEYKSDCSCALKLLGDICSFGESLPPDIFKDENGSASNDDDNSIPIMAACSKVQIAFVSKGKEQCMMLGQIFCDNQDYFVHHLEREVAVELKQQP